jgi:hypothetical protein
MGMVETTDWQLRLQVRGESKPKLPWVDDAGLIEAVSAWMGQIQQNPARGAARAGELLDGSAAEWVTWRGDTGRARATRSTRSACGSLEPSANN